MNKQLEQIKSDCEKSLKIYAQWVLPERYFGDLHMDIFDFIQYGKGDDNADGKLILVPRDHQKSVCIAVAASWFITNDPSVTINGADYNEINFPICNECTDSGVSIDGIITSSGDGGRYNKINHPICNDGTSAIYGGIFCGNGSSYNEIIHPICNGNAGAGIRFSGGAGYENASNRIIDPVCNSNSVNGMTLSFCPDMLIENPTCESNTGRGIADLDCDGLKIIGGKVDGNTTEGILHQSPRTKDIGVTATNNNDGIKIAFGGTLGLGDNISIDCHISGNATNQYVSASGSRAINCTGFKTDNRGAITKADGQTIAHGLSSTPARVNATGSVAGEIVTVTAVGATTFTVAIKTGGGAAGTSQTIYWEASLY